MTSEHDETPTGPDVTGPAGDADGAPFPPREAGAQAPAGDGTDAPDETGTSGVDTWLEEGGPVEPSDLDADARLLLAQEEAADRTRDLQRLQAEYVNYKRRVERDRDLVVQNATYKALTPIVDVLDNIDRAREHGEVDGGFKSVAEQLERVVATAGLVKFGAVGDAFDPSFHEAISHLGEDAEVTVTTCKVVAKAGYRIGDRVVRAAQVLVVDPPA